LDVAIDKSFAVQNLALGTTKIGENNLLVGCVNEQMHGVFQAASKRSSKDTGDSKRRVWDSGGNNIDGGGYLSILSAAYTYFDLFIRAKRRFTFCISVELVTMACQYLIFSHTTEHTAHYFT